MAVLGYATAFELRLSPALTDNDAQPINFGYSKHLYG